MKTILSAKAPTGRCDAILHAAGKLFAEKGYHTVSTEEIAKAAGVSKGLVHYHFRSKADLLQRLLLDSVMAISSRIEDIRQADMPARSRIRATVVAYAEFGNRRLSLIRNAHLVGPAQAEGSAHARVHGLIEEEKLALAHLIEDGVAGGEFRPVDSRVAASVLAGAIHELIMGAALEEKPVPVERAADEITSILCEGIGC